MAREVSNEGRGQRAQIALDAYIAQFPDGEYGQAELEVIVSDLQADLMHLLATTTGADFESAVRRGRVNYHAERTPQRPDGLTRIERQEMSDAHGEGLHDDLAREGCPECERYGAGR